MQFEYDPERLIEEVRKRPGIWDFYDANYRTKETRHKLWTEVIVELLNGQKVTKSEMRELEIQLQKKWKSMRDCFNKYVQNPKRTRRPYIYSKQLQFLLQKTDPGEPEVREGASSESDEGKKPVKWHSRKKTLSIAKEEENASSDDDNVIYQEDCPSLGEVEINLPPSKIPRTTKPIYDEFAFANVDQKTEEDTDKMFLLSLLPHLKAIPERHRLNVKMELMQVLRQASYGIDTDHKII